MGNVKTLPNVPLSLKFTIAPWMTIKFASITLWLSTFI